MVCPRASRPRGYTQTRTRSFVRGRPEPATGADSLLLHAPNTPVSGPDLRQACTLSKTVLATGRAEFIGSHVTDRLLADGQHSVVGIDSFEDYYSRADKEKNLESAVSSPASDRTPFVGPLIMLVPGTPPV